MSNEDLQSKINQKNKLIQDKKKLIQNLKNLDQVQKEVQHEIDKIMPEKNKFEEWARYFGNDGKSRQVLGWFSDELKKHQQKLERVQNMRDKILGVQEKLDQQIARIEKDIEDSEKPSSIRQPEQKAVSDKKMSPITETESVQRTFSKDRNRRSFRKDTKKFRNKFSAFSSKPVTDGRPGDKKSEKNEKSDKKKSEKDAVLSSVNQLPNERIDNLEALKSQLKKTGLVAGSKSKNEDKEPDSKIADSSLDNAGKSDAAKNVTPDSTPLEQESGTEKKDSITETSDKPDFKVAEKEVAEEKTLKPKKDFFDLNPKEIIPEKKSDSAKEKAEKTSHNKESDFLITGTPSEKREQVSMSVLTQAKSPIDRKDQSEIARNNLQTAESELSSKKLIIDDESKKEAKILKKEPAGLPRREVMAVKEVGKKNSFRSIFGRFTSKSVSEKNDVVESEYENFLDPEEEIESKAISEENTESGKKQSYIQKQPLRAKTIESEIDVKDEDFNTKITEESVTASSDINEVNKKETEDLKIKDVPSEGANLTAPEDDTANLENVEIDYAWMNQEVRSEIKKTIMTPGIQAETLYLGIDLGTYETTIAASNGMIASTVSAVGWTKDIISRRFLKTEILFGEEAMRNKLALDFYRPLADGVIKDTEKDQEAARELIKHVLKLVKPENYKKVYAVIGAPAQASLKNQQAILDAAREIIDSVTIISEPFAVAYGEANIYNTLVIDIGAGTTDICRLRGTMPAPEDQITITKAGDFIDYQLMEDIEQRIKGAQVSKDMVRRWKEAYSFVIKAQKPIIVEVTVEGKPLKVDITASILKACEAIVGDIETSVTRLISTFDPEFQPALKQNILLAGGGSLIRNLDICLQNKLKPLGNVIIKKVRNPIEAGAIGALSLAMDVTDDYWRGL